jgi:uncharacterized protein YjbJ (UPF0337 family)
VKWEEIEANWKMLKGSVRETWGKLTGSEITKIEGRFERLVGALQKRYCLTREEAEGQVLEWKRGLELRAEKLFHKGDAKLEELIDSLSITSKRKEKLKKETRKKK